MKKLFIIITFILLFVILLSMPTLLTVILYSIIPDVFIFRYILISIYVAFVFLSGIFSLAIVSSMVNGTEYYRRKMYIYIFIILMILAILVALYFIIH